MSGIANEIESVNPFKAQMVKRKTSFKIETDSDVPPNTASSSTNDDSVNPFKAQMKKRTSFNLPEGTDLSMLDKSPKREEPQQNPYRNVLRKSHPAPLSLPEAAGDGGSNADGGTGAATGGPSGGIDKHLVGAVKLASKGSIDSPLQKRRQSKVFDFATIDTMNTGPTTKTSVSPSFDIVSAIQDKRLTELKETYNEKFNQVVFMNDQLNKQVGDMQRKLKDANDSQKKVEDTATKNYLMVKTERDKNEDLQAENMRLVKELQAERASVERLQKEKAKLEVDSKKHEQDLASKFSTEYQRLKQAFEMMQSRYESKKSLLGLKCQDLDKLLGVNFELGQQIEMLKKLARQTGDVGNNSLVGGVTPRLTPRLAPLSPAPSSRSNIDAMSTSSYDEDDDMIMVESPNSKLKKSIQFDDEIRDEEPSPRYSDRIIQEMREELEREKKSLICEHDKTCEDLQLTIQDRETRINVLSADIAQLQSEISVLKFYVTGQDESGKLSEDDEATESEHKRLLNKFYLKCIRLALNGSNSGSDAMSLVDVCTLVENRVLSLQCNSRSDHEHHFTEQVLNYFGPQQHQWMLQALQRGIQRKGVRGVSEARRNGVSANDEDSSVASHMKVNWLGDEYLEEDGGYPGAGGHRGHRESALYQYENDSISDFRDGGSDKSETDVHATDTEFTTKPQTAEKPLVKSTSDRRNSNSAATTPQNIHSYSNQPDSVKKINIDLQQLLPSGAFDSGTLPLGLTLNIFTGSSTEPIVLKGSSGRDRQPESNSNTRDSPHTNATPTESTRISRGKSSPPAVITSGGVAVPLLDFNGTSPKNQISPKNNTSQINRTSPKHRNSPKNEKSPKHDKLESARNRASPTTSSSNNRKSFWSSDEDTAMDGAATTTSSGKSAQKIPVRRHTVSSGSGLTMQSPRRPPPPSPRIEPHDNIPEKESPPATAHQSRTRGGEVVIDSVEKTERKRSIRTDASPSNAPRTQVSPKFSSAPAMNRRSSSSPGDVSPTKMDITIPPHSTSGKTSVSTDSPSTSSIVSMFYDNDNLQNALSLAAMTSPRPSPPVAPKSVGRNAGVNAAKPSQQRRGSADNRPSGSATAAASNINNPQNALRSHGGSNAMPRGASVASKGNRENGTQEKMNGKDNFNEKASSAGHNSRRSSYSNDRRPREGDEGQYDHRYPTPESSSRRSSRRSPDEEPFVQQPARVRRNEYAGAMERKHTDHYSISHLGEDKHREIPLFEDEGVETQSSYFSEDGHVIRGNLYTDGEPRVTVFARNSWSRKGPSESERHTASQYKVKDVPDGLQGHDTKPAPIRGNQRYYESTPSQRVSSHVAYRNTLPIRESPLHESHPRESFRDTMSRKNSPGEQHRDRSASLDMPVNGGYAHGRPQNDNYNWQEDDGDSVSLEQDSQLSSYEHDDNFVEQPDSRRYSGSYSTDYAEHRRSLAATQDYYMPEPTVSQTYDNYRENDQYCEATFPSDEESYTEDEEGDYYYR